MKTRLLVPELGFSAGSESVLLQVLPRWVGAGCEVVLAAPSYRLRRYRERGLDARVRCVPLGWAGHGWRRLAGLLSHRAGWRWLQKAGWRDQVKRENATHVFLPWVVQQPAVNFGVPVGAMLMDLAWRHYPEGWFGWTTQRMDFAIRRWLEKANVVFPVSESTAIEVKAAFPGGEQKLVTVPHGAEWRGGKANRDVGPVDYFLTPAGTTPNKNHIGLLTAAIQLWREGLEFRLVWTGPGTGQVTASDDAGSGELKQLQQLYRKNESLIAGRFEGLGFVSDQKLDDLFQGACRVVLPSTYEGFGLPVMEAFERGKRVICTDIAPFLEQVDRHQLRDWVNLVAMGNNTELADALRAAILEIPVPTDSAEEAELRRRVEAWTWDDAARRYLEVLTAQ